MRCCMCKKQSVAFFIFALVLLSCGATYSVPGKDLDYDFDKPDVSFVLPEILHEISGLAIIDSSTFACVQDENGILFIYDAVGKRIKNEYPFNIDGDYEGITRVGDTMYVLRSDGVLFEVAHYGTDNFTLQSYNTRIPADNNEGLCYDRAHNRLLIACKSKIGKGAEFKDRRAVYGFDLETKTRSVEPVFDFDLKTIRDFALENNVDLPVKSKKNQDEVVIKFATSAIGIHPVTKKLFLLSAADHLLFIFSMEGTIERIQQLDKKLFNKPEGIAFYENGDMLITNEGQNKKPTLLRFNYRAGK